MKESKLDKMQCEQCRQEVHFADEFTTVEKSVSGPRGVVPLGNVFVFCSDECVAKYFQHYLGKNGNDLSFRIP